MLPKRKMLLRNLREAECCWTCVHSLDERFGLTCLVADNIRITVQKHEVCDDFKRFVHVEEEEE